MKTIKLRVETLEDRSTPSCSSSDVWGDYASNSYPGAVGIFASHEATMDPAGWAAGNVQFGQSLGCN